MPIELPKAYEPKDAQQKWLAFWDEKKYFHADPANPGEPYTIVIPPPNVTGALHMGHALNNTLQDVLIRWRRMQGRNALWMPGTDHAGIATQAVVERLVMQTEKKTRHDLGRDALVAKIWEWKDKYEARILGQLKQMGASCDWARTRFTLDERCARAVRETFFRMFRDGYIYRGKRLVNWDCQLQTSVADDETENIKQKGKFYFFRYPVLSGPANALDAVLIATTRPETMLGDTAVAVHPEPRRELEKREKELEKELTTAGEKESKDIEQRLERLRKRRDEMLPQLEKLAAMAAAGTVLELPLVGRKIPLIADRYADPEKGTGAVKITPAHDFNDYEVGLRHPEIGPPINMLNPDGTINDVGRGEFRGRAYSYVGQERFAARDAVVADLTELELFVKEEEIENTLPISDRSKTPIEPFLSDQWFVKMGDFDTPHPNPSPGDGFDLPHKGGGGGGASSPQATDGKGQATPTSPLVGEVGDTKSSRVGGTRIGLAQMAMDAVTSGKVKFFPERYAKTYLDWLGEKRDWCISRQLWWGHRIPVWSIGPVPLLDTERDHYATWLAKLKDDHPNKLDFKMEVGDIDAGGVASTFITACVAPDSIQLERELEKGKFTQEEDVLDTWFSSALWPHSTLGWPEQTPELKRYYPTSTLVTSRDIITLWVARMVLTGLYNLDEIPFHHVYITPKIMDGFGEGMSKSKGNGADPLDIIDLYGADAMRYGVVSLATETQDARMPISNMCPHCGVANPQKKEHQSGRTKKVNCSGCKKAFRPSGPWLDEDPELPTAKAASDRFEPGRNFANKLWNATRFILMNLEGYSQDVINPVTLSIEDRWILSRLATTAGAVTKALDTYKFADAAKLIYEFAWSEFCDWYIEMSKARRSDPACQRVLVGVLDGILRLVHPVMPFVAESLWKALGEVAPERGFPTPKKAEEAVCIAAWPAYPDTLIDASTESAIARMQEVIRGVRELRNRYSLDKTPLTLAVKCSDAVAKELQPLSPFITQLGGLTGFECGPGVTKPKQAGSIVTGDFEAYVPLAGLIDPAAEAKRLEKQIADIRKQLDGMAKKLGDEKYVRNAPPEVVAETREKVAELEKQAAVLTGNLADLKAD